MKKIVDKLMQLYNTKQWEFYENIYLIFLNVVLVICGIILIINFML